MKRRLRKSIVTASLLSATLAAIVWWGSQSTWQTIYVRLGGSFWHVHSAVGLIVVDRYAGWPDPPGWSYRATRPDVSEATTPVFVTGFAGATRRTSTWHAFEFVRGTVRVPVRSDGSADFGSPALPALRSIRSATLSPLISFWSIRSPDWFVVSVFLVLPTVHFARLSARAVRAAVRRSRRRCVGCGYDVRESPDRCPECGRAVRTSHTP